MESKLPVQLLKPRLLGEVPRSKYMQGPKLKNKDEKSRLSFISLLRKGIASHSNSQQRPVVVGLECALWLSVNKPISSTISLLLQCKEIENEYCLLLDEVSTSDSETIMLSGSATIRHSGEIVFLGIACSGIPKDYHVMVNDLHIESSIYSSSQFYLDELNKRQA